MRGNRLILLSVTAALASALSAKVCRADHQFCGTDILGRGIAWSGSSTPLTVDPGGWPQGTPWLGDVFAEVQVQNAWSNFDFSITIGPGGWAPGRNDLVYVNGPDTMFPTAVAVTYNYHEPICGAITPPCCVNGGTTPSHIIESDIVFYANNSNGVINWLTGNSPRIVNSSDMDRSVSFDRHTLSHEMLHAIGVTHSTSNLGQARISPSGTGWFDDGAFEPLARDLGDLRKLYGGTSTGVGSMYGLNLQSVWPHDGTVAPLGWDPSTNTPDTFPRNRTPIAGQPTNRVRKGQAMDFRWCVGNRASSSQTVPMRLFLSRDATLSESSDTLVTTINFSAWPAESSQCGQSVFSIPNTQGVGTYNLFYRMGNATDPNVAARTVILNRQIVVIN